MLQRLMTTVQSTLPAASPDRLHRDIEVLEHQAWSESWETKAQLFKRLGDLCMATAERKRALSYYGRGIDAHLVLGNYEAAAALCRKVIATMPEVVRARCTLAFLSLGSSSVEEFDHLLADYVRAARRAGQAEWAAIRLRMMANVTDAHDVRLLLGHYLKELGDPQSAGEVFEAIFAERKARRSSPHEDQQARWARALRVTLTSASGRAEEVA